MMSMQKKDSEKTRLAKPSWVLAARASKVFAGLLAFSLLFSAQASNAFDSFEHLWLGDSVQLSFYDGAEQSYGDDYPYRRTMRLILFLMAQNGISIPKPKPQYLLLDDRVSKYSFGEIVATAGDFIADPEGVPISAPCEDSPDASCMSKVEELFSKSFNYIKNYPQNPFVIAGGRRDLLQSIYSSELTVLAAQIGPSRGIHQALARNSSPTSKIQASLFGLYTAWPFYRQILKNNVDHFSEDAVQTYRAGHSLALNTALAAFALYRKGEKKAATQKLNEAYAIEAFACHYLTDLFSAGHVRVPRRELRRITGMSASNGGAIAGAMHNEDSYLGLNVENARGSKWRAYGDSSYFDMRSLANREAIAAALAAAIGEVWAAASTGERPSGYEALSHIPFLDQSAANHYPLAKVFSPEDIKVRADYHRPELNEYVNIKAHTGLSAFLKNDIFTFDHSNFLHFLESEEGADYNRYKVNVYCYFGKFERGLLSRNPNYFAVPRRYLAHYIPEGTPFQGSTGVSAENAYYVVSERDAEELYKSCLIAAEGGKLVEIRANYYTSTPKDLPVVLHYKAGRLHRLLGKGYNYYHTKTPGIKESLREFEIE